MLVEQQPLRRPDLHLHGEHGHLRGVRTAFQQPQVPVVEDALAGPGDIDRHDSGHHGSEYVSAVHRQRAARGGRVVVEQLAVVVPFVDVCGISSSAVRLRRTACVSSAFREPVVGRHERIGGPERVIFRIDADLRRGQAGVLLEVPAELGQLRRAGGVEVYACAETVAPEAFLDAGIQDLEYDAVVLELDLGLRRVDVDVYAVRVGFQKNEIRRRRAVCDEVLVCLHDGLVEVGAAEIAPVDEEELVPQRLLRGVRAAYVAFQAHHRGLGGNVHEFGAYAVPQQVLDAEFPRFGFLQHEDVAAAA